MPTAAEDQEEQSGSIGSAKDLAEANGIANGTSTPMASAAAAAASPPPKSLCWLFDWDDTLFPRSFFRNLRVSCRKECSPKMLTDLQAVEAKGIKVMERALARGDVVVISNATQQWLVHSGEEFLPNLVTYLNTHGVERISARDINERDDIMHWKTNAFMAQVQRRLPGLEAVVSIGDDQYEMHALDRVADRYRALRTNKVKLEEQPDIQELQMELDVLEQKLYSVLEAPGTLWQIRLPNREHSRQTFLERAYAPPPVNDKARLISSQDQSKICTGSFPPEFVPEFDAMLASYAVSQANGIGNGTTATTTTTTTSLAPLAPPPPTPSGPAAIVNRISVSSPPSPFPVPTMVAPPPQPSAVNPLQQCDDMALPLLPLLPVAHSQIQGQGINAHAVTPPLPLSVPPTRTLTFSDMVCVDKKGEGEGDGDGDEEDGKAPAASEKNAPTRSISISASAMPLPVLPLPVPVWPGGPQKHKRGAPGCGGGGGDGEEEDAGGDAVRKPMDEPLEDILSEGEAACTPHASKLPSFPSSSTSHLSDGTSGAKDDTTHTNTSSTNTNTNINTNTAVAELTHGEGDDAEADDVDLEGYMDVAGGEGEGEGEGMEAEGEYFDALAMPMEIEEMTAKPMSQDFLLPQD
ncbi:unnamed protein product [Vitrella brassicaformis CCMP3155]|uniref:Uncharacterized protein n=1 Tax=Vitrella brassicaformis (strain CCMP3155) TaxID=1169540 RepID=A0A0G4EAJ1_VITBC|nr:unnamed protein product [Vitrella brassicaformis CCMP3155]|eukprot:CEL92278.1 unnamed protein product [Vitrella brassicaformis CCMP3155]